jgi:hypothetical protein
MSDKPNLSPAARRRIVVVTATIAALVAIDLSIRGLRPTLEQYTVREYAKKTTAFVQRDNAPIVLMGSSRAKYALVPRVFEQVTGRSAFNLAIAGAKTAEWQSLAKQVFDLHPPALVVLGINASEVRADYLPTDAARELFTLPDILESVQIEGPSADVLSGYLHKSLGPAWALMNQRYELKMFLSEQADAILPKHSQHARELRRRVATACPVDGYEHPWQFGRQLRTLEQKMLEDVASADAASLPAFDPNAPAFTRLCDLLDDLRKIGTARLVAYLPNSPATEARWSQIEPKMVDRIAQVCQDAGAEFVDCRMTIGPRSNSDYMEELHVGYPLARRISETLARRVVAAGLIEVSTHRLAEATGEGEESR